MSTLAPPPAASAAPIAPIAPIAPTALSTLVTTTPVTQHVRIRAAAVIVRDGHILAVEYDDEHGLHYNLPGGGLEPGESLDEGVRREVLEETAAHVDVGRLLIVTEWGPRHLPRATGVDSPDDVASPLRYELGMYFECHLHRYSEPRLPDHPDANQTAVRWLPLADLPALPLLPRIAENVIASLAHPLAANPHYRH